MAITHHVSNPHQTLHTACKPRCTVVASSYNLPKISSFDVISRVFPSKFQEIHFIFVSGHCMRFVFKIYQTVAGVSATSQFHEFVEFYFWRVFAIWTNCALPPISKAILNSTRNQLSTVGHFAPSI